ncbi:uncharacterized protein [Primulina eburnea]|uniref:uncharacterized protein n=1 Tax=Primulina eburnea TaxID=1245227 RepID=UPI003C6BE0B7
MKESNFILSSLIPGPEGPGDAIDVYLKPLIEELKESWELGIETFDASTRQNFKLHASLLWTINDFPAYGNLSGWSTKATTNGEKIKVCLMELKGKTTATFTFSADVLAQVNDLEGIILNKDVKRKVKISHENRGDNWNKKSIFFEIPYLSSLLLRHNLDVMHIEKNICENMVKTIMNTKGNTKDNVQARLDLEALKIRPDLHPIRKGDKLELPIASYTLSTEEKHLLGAKILKVCDLQKIESQIPITLCKLEQVFLPSFFDVMVHLPVHLSKEAIIGGPVPYRWMYPIERMLFELKQLIRNMARPEGSIAEGYIAKESMTLCSRYLKDIETKFSILERNYDSSFHKFKGEISIFLQCGRALGAGISHILGDDAWEKAHIYILKNCDEVQPFLEEYSKNEKNNTPQLSDDEWNSNFIGWFKQQVDKMKMQDQHTKYDDLLSLCRGPSMYVTCFNGYVVNGFRFRIEARDKGCRTQNSGVCVIGNIGSEKNYVDYYGVFTEILELQYLDGKRVVLFRCRWFDVHDNEKGAKVDEYGFTNINCQHTSSGSI